MTDKAEDEIAGYYLTAVSAPAFGESGPLVTQPTAAVYLDGASQECLADGPTGRVYYAAGQPYTFVAFAKIPSLPATFNTIAFNGDGVAAAGGYGMGIYQGTRYLGGVNENVAFMASDLELTDLTWHLCMMGRDSGTTYWWLDGVRGNTTSASVPQTPTDSFSIGSHRKSGSWQRLFTGWLSEVAFFDRILTDDDAEALQLARDPADWEFGGAVGAMPVWRWEAAEHGDAVTWARIVSPTHTADAVDAAATARLGPRQRVQPVVDADSDVKAGDYAAAVLAAYAEAAPARHGRVFAPWHPGVELGDVVRVDVTGDGVDAALFRVAALTLEYTRRGDSPTPYSLTLDLATL